MKFSMKILRAGNRQPLQQDQEFPVLLPPERRNGIGGFSKQGFYLRGRAVSVTDPNNRGSRAGDLAAFLKIRILGHDHKTVLPCVVPDCFIAGAVKVYRLDVQ